MAKMDLKLNAPKDKRDLTKENMYDFIEKHGSDEDKAWFVKLMNENKIKKANNLKNGEETISYKYDVVREEFAKRFFPTISKKAKKAAKKESKKKPTFEEKLAALVK